MNVGAAVRGGRRLKRAILFVTLLAALPLAVLGAQALAAQVGGSAGAGCETAVFVPPPGAIRVRAMLGSDALRGAFDAGALEAYLADRTGRAVEVSTVVGDRGAFEALAGERRVWSDVLVFFADAPRIEGVVAADGTAGGLGYARENGACVLVAFDPAAPVAWVDDAGAEHGLQPAYTYFAHELGHVFGLRHSPEGIMGHGAYHPLEGDTFSAAQRAAFARVGA